MREIEFTDAWYNKIEWAIKETDFSYKIVREFHLDESVWSQLSEDFIKYLIRKNFISVKKAIQLTNETNLLNLTYIQYAIETGLVQHIDDVFDELEKPTAESNLIPEFIRSRLLPSKAITLDEFIKLNKDQLMLLDVPEIQWALCTNPSLLPHVLKLTFHEWENIKADPNFKIDNITNENSTSRFPKRCRLFVDPDEDEKQHRQNWIETRSLYATR